MDLRRWASSPTIWPVAVVMAAASGYAALPPGGLGRAVTATAGVAVATLGLVHATWRSPRRQAAVRLTLTASGVALLANHLLAVLGPRLGGDVPTFPAPVHLLYPLSTVLLAVGIDRLVSGRRQRDVGSAVDAMIVATSVGAGATLLVVLPAWSVVGLDLVGRLLAVGFPVSQVLLLAAATRLVTTGPRTPTAHLLVAAAGVHASTSLGLAGLIALDRYAPGSVLAFGPAAALLLAGVAAHATAADGSDEGAADRVRPPSAPRRIRVLAAALLVFPLLQLATARSLHDGIVVAATVALLALITLRIGLLLRERERATHRELRDQEARGHRRFEAIVRHASDVLIVLDRSGRVSYASPSAVEVLGRDPLGWGPTALLRLLHPQERRATSRALAERLGGAEGRPVRLTARLDDRDGTEIHIDLVAVDLRADPDVRGIVLTVRDSTERIALERQLRHLAFHDALTGLCNRELFHDRLTQALSRARRTGRRLAVLLCDLDDFKDINDTLGHAAGDRLLTVVAERLKVSSRAADTVARLGGDEFAVLLEDLEDARAATEAARRVLAATDQPIRVDGHELAVGVSVGIAVDDGERSAQELLRDADVALYEAKGSGKHRWSLHRPPMTHRAQARLQFAAELTRAIEDGDIHVAFQPIVALADDRVVGVEGLARWHHPTRGWVPPAEFIPLAEQTGQILPLGEAVLTTVLRTLRGWLDVRPDLVLRAGPNLSARQLRDPSLPGRVERLLEELELDPAFLVLELTESVMLDDPAQAVDVMTRLRGLGIRFAVDDFGTGYSSLSYLRRLPVDIIKVDRSFIRELDTDTGADNVVAAIVDLARSLNLDVVAEGVETVRQRDILRSMGCGFAQGYLFGRPTGAEELTPRLVGPEARVVTDPPAAARTGALAGAPQRITSGPATS